VRRGVLGAWLVLAANQAAEHLATYERRDLDLRCVRALLAEQNLDGPMRMQAGVDLLKAGEEDEAVTLLTARGDGDFLSGQTPIPLLECVLEVLRRKGPTSACSPCQRRGT
jgi:hypothetical protein